LDLMFLGKREPVLNVVDSGTNFNAATFLKGESSAEIWNALLLCWSRVYCGDPQEILTDSCMAFCSEEFYSLCEQHDIIIRHTLIEQHNALGQGENFHSSLRRTFNKVSLEYPNVPREVLLQLAVYALNTSANAHGLVPCLLVFGTLPRLPFVSATDPVSNNDRFTILATAREEFKRHRAEQRIACGLKTKVPSATDVIYQKWDSVYV
jgi:transposase InsO family protein